MIPDSPQITYFAETNHRNMRQRFGIKRADRRRHMYVIGKTGTGKTTMLDNMAIQDIQRGNGLAVIDPHGEFAERMLSFIPRERLDDVVYFNPADLDMPLGFNMLEKPSEEMRHFVASGLMSVFKKLWVDAWSARMEYFLSNSILTHLEIPGATLMGVQRIFGDKEYRKTVVSQVQDPIVKSFWENEFAKLPEQFMREAVAAIQNKVGQFISNPLIRNIIGQPYSTFDLRKLMDEKKILIANLAKGRVGEENSKLLGAMLVTKIYLAAMSRVDVSEDEREDFYVYVDEFQNFATEAFANILSEARKYHLNLTLAHQYMAQLVDDKTKSSLLRDAIIGNVGTLVSFRVGAEDAEVLEKEFLPAFAIQDFVSLGFANIYLKLMIDGVASPAFSAVTLPPITPPAENLRDEAIRRSQEKYGRPATEVSETVNRWNASIPAFGGVPRSEPKAFGSLAELLPKPAPKAEPAPPPVERGRELQTSSAPREPEMRPKVSEARPEVPAVTSQPEPIGEKKKENPPAGRASPQGGPPPESLALKGGPPPASLAPKGGKKEKTMYKTVCAIDGKEIEVPFQPDGRRPVYCQEHLSQIQRGGKESQPAKPSASQKEPNPSRREERRMSLNELLPSGSRKAEPERERREAPRALQNPPKKQVDISELRKVLQETIQERKTPVIPKAIEPKPEGDSGVIRPGESIRFD